MSMGSMNISIKEEAYNLLKSLKHSNQSFSEVIIELVSDKKKGSSKDIMKFAGILKDCGDEYWEDVKREIYDSRKRSRIRDKKIEEMI